MVAVTASRYFRIRSGTVGRDRLLRCAKKPSPVAKKTSNHCGGSLFDTGLRTMSVEPNKPQAKGFEVAAPVREEYILGHSLCESLLNHDDVLLIREGQVGAVPPWPGIPIDDAGPVHSLR